MNKLYLITGPAGVGKSTVSRCIAEKLEKSVLIEGDDIYNQFVGGRISPWKKDAPIELFWDNCIYLINKYLENGYDVVFNYIIHKERLEIIKKKIIDCELHFNVLLVDEKNLLERDKLRPEDCQMKERCLVLLKEFISDNYDEKYILDTSKLSVEETVLRVLGGKNNVENI